MKEDNLKIAIRLVNETDLRFLFNLLKERDEEINISHKKIPTYYEHKKFVLSKPYSKWYIIFNENKKIGSIYLSKQDEIGIFLKNEVQKEGIGSKTLKLLMKKNPRNRYLANINPKNKKSIKFFQKNKFKILQHTYELSCDNW